MPMVCLEAMMCKGLVIGSTSGGMNEIIEDGVNGYLVPRKSPVQLAECIEKPDYPYFIGVQWHPEYLWEKDPAAARLFESFVDAAR